MLTYVKIFLKKGYTNHIHIEYDSPLNLNYLMKKIIAFGNYKRNYRN